MFRALSQEELAEDFRVTVPPTNRARAGWSIDIVQVKLAMDHLGLELPVVFRFTAGRYTWGTHCTWEEPNLHHRITVSQDRDIDLTNTTIWHELTHAQQSEEFAKRENRPINKFYREAYYPNRGPWGNSYKQNYYEILARQLAEDQKDWRLVK